MKMNKNIFALALFFANFTTQAHQKNHNNVRTVSIRCDDNCSVENSTTVTMINEKDSAVELPSHQTVMNGAFEMSATADDGTILLAITRNDITTHSFVAVVSVEEAVSMLSSTNDTTKVLNGMKFVCDEVTYFVTNDTTRTINLTINVTVHITDATEEEIITIDVVNNDSNNPTELDNTTAPENEVVAEAINANNSDSDTTEIPVNETTITTEDVIKTSANEVIVTANDVTDVESSDDINQ